MQSFQLSFIAVTLYSYILKKKKRPIFMILYLLIQLRCRKKKQNPNVYQTSDTQKFVFFKILSSYLEGLLNLM